MTDLTADYLALRREAGAVEVRRDVVRVSGPEALTWLQGQLSQDVAALAVGAAAWSFLLQPQGRLEALVRVVRTGDDELVLHTDEGAAEALVAHLTRFKLRTKAELEQLDWRCVALRGPDVATMPVPPVDAATNAVVADAGWPGLPGLDLLGPAPAAPEGVRRCDPAAYEAVRIEAGVPRVGVDTDERTMPHETGMVEAAVSFTKGCFLGQELVARVDSRGGRAPRLLRGVVLGTNVLPPVGASIRVAGDDSAKERGTVTSVAESLDLRAPVALALVARDVEAPAEVTVVWDGGEAPARVASLPLVGATA
jgi:tRNA-modifying protein YgfZ